MLELLEHAIAFLLATACRHLRQLLFDSLLESLVHGLFFFTTIAAAAEDKCFFVAVGRRAQLSEGCYLLRTNVTDWSDEELWKAYIQLTEAEAAFRIHKSDLSIDFGVPTM